MEQLRAQLDELLNRLEQPDDVRSRLDELISVYPFNEFEYIISHLLAADVLTLDDYHRMRDEYMERNHNLRLYVMAPATFSKWSLDSLRQYVQGLQKPSSELDSGYSSGEYDLFLPPRIRIEVKASRAAEYKNNEPLYIKALSSDSTRRFDMNFQQIKPELCDVFVWIAAWRDVIRYWVFSSYEVESNSYYSAKQHRGNVGEGQLHITQDNIHEFDPYLVRPNELETTIQSAYERQQQQVN